MAYGHTTVAPEKSQGAIKKLLMTHGSVNISFASSYKPTRQEGFAATVHLMGSHGDNKPYAIKVVVPVREMPDDKKQDQEIRRVWRVLYHHMKALFEAGDTGVIDIRKLLLPFLVTKGGRTVGDVIIEDMPKAIEAPKQMFLG